MGSASRSQQQTDSLDQSTKKTIKRIAYEHGMSFEDALKYYMRNID